MRRQTLLQSVLVGATVALLVGAHALTGSATVVPGGAAAAALAAVPALAAGAVDEAVTTARTAPAARREADAALAAFASIADRLSDAHALADAFESYYAFRAAHPDVVRKPYLYFVDYGLSNTTPRGYVFDMASLTLVDGPFMVAHGRGSSGPADGVPHRFSNATGSAATSLGLYVAQELYAFTGHTGGTTYHSTGLRLQGVSTGYNDNARARGVVAHGAPYVTATRAGRSEGCPAVDPARAERLLPKLAEGSMVFLYAPDARWLAGDPWLTASAG